MSVAGRGDVGPAFLLSIVGTGCSDDHVVAVPFVVDVVDSWADTVIVAGSGRSGRWRWRR